MKTLLSIQFAAILIAAFGIGAKITDMNEQYEEKQEAHEQVLQEKRELQEETAQLEKEKKSLAAALLQQERQMDKKEKELEQVQQNLAVATDKLVQTGIVPPDEAGLAETAATIHVKATAYSADPSENGGTYNGKVLTRTGFSLTDNPHAKVIAVDPSIIPLGSTVWVEGYGYAKALDTGGAIKGNRIDVFISDEERMEDWGVRKIQVKVMKQA